MASENEIVPLNGITPTQLYSEPETMTAILDRITVEAVSHESDTTTVKGRAAITSVAYKVTRSKTFLDEIGKTLVADLKAKVAAVDGERRRVREHLDNLRDQVRRPLEEWEAAEAKRKADHEDALATLKDFLAVDGLASPQLETNLAKAQEIMHGRDWQEYGEQAGETIVEISRKIRDQIARLAKEAELKAERERIQAELDAERAKLKAEQEKARATLKAEHEKARAELEAERANLKAEKDRLRSEMAEMARQKADAEKENEERLRATDIRYAANPPDLQSCLPEVVAINMAGSVPALAAYVVEQSPPPTIATVINSKPKVNSLSESTFLQMTHVIKALLKLVDRLYLDHEDSQIVAKAEELRQTALAELKRSGITVE